MEQSSDANKVSSFDQTETTNQQQQKNNKNYV